MGGYLILTILIISFRAKGPCSTSDDSYILSAITSQYIQLFTCIPAEKIALLQDRTFD